MMGGYFMHTPSGRLQKSSESADREKRLGNIGGYTGGNFAYQVFHPDGLSPALLSMGNGGGRMPHIVVSYENRTSA